MAFSIWLTAFLTGQPTTWDPTVVEEKPHPGLAPGGKGLRLGSREPPLPRGHGPEGSSNPRATSGCGSSTRPAIWEPSVTATPAQSLPSPPAQPFGGCPGPSPRQGEEVGSSKAPREAERVHSPHLQPLGSPLQNPRPELPGGQTPVLLAGDRSRVQAPVHQHPVNPTEKPVPKGHHPGAAQICDNGRELAATDALWSKTDLPFYY